MSNGKKTITIFVLLIIFIFVIHVLWDHHRVKNIAFKNLQNKYNFISFQIFSPKKQLFSPGSSVFGLDYNVPVTAEINGMIIKFWIELNDKGEVVFENLLDQKFKIEGANVVNQMISPIIRMSNTTINFIGGNGYSNESKNMESYYLSMKFTEMINSNIRPTSMNAVIKWNEGSENLSNEAFIEKCLGVATLLNDLRFSEISFYYYTTDNNYLNITLYTRTDLKLPKEQLIKKIQVSQNIK
ncbi:hypothetical protein LOZ80_30040 [Paenibacillus sp. HWE-109]|uniref:hypothetical protein n=1 Tax=Paenibacillus sp. HWE-109 TaxID=1306526 RepID=UPI001EDFC79E|nr:hypothetical protein [Paenibacillus sp. HWE-109]UKS25762.1 hypothetical protein LOZ80_30040 [Paenibacillus sp. HWE-109]